MARNCEFLSGPMIAPSTILPTLTPIDVGLGFLEGALSCLTPEALLLLPLVPAAARSVDRLSMIALAVGLALSPVLTGILAGSFGVMFGVSIGLEATLLRRIVCAGLVVLGFALMSASMVERFPLLTGGGAFAALGSSSRGAAFRRLLLGLLLGANWLPRAAPTLLKASLMAADTRDLALALGTLFMFGLAASLPWIVLGRIVRLLLRPVASGAIEGMAAKRFLGLTLVVVAIVGASGLELAMAHRIDTLLPPWTGKLAVRF
jgi:cytochrome c-type biogenesis protein